MARGEVAGDRAGAVRLWGDHVAPAVSPWKDWALEHSIAEVVSTTDRRAGNRVDTVDEPIAVVASAVVMFTGAWIGLLVPCVMNRSNRKQLIAAGFDPDEPEGPKN